jgi:DNA-binding MarR family transcriptional regulator
MARYDAKRKIKRNQQLLEYRRQNPDLSLREIGDAFGVTPGRVWALLRRLEQKGR